MSDPVLAATSAVFNVLATVLLITGRLAIRRGDRERHGRLMGAALLASALFLAAYLGRWILFEPHRFAGEGLWRGVYLAILFPHMLLAMTVPYFAVRALLLARAGRFEEHVRLVRVGWPVWLFVSVTGVVVYGMLYHWPAAAAA